MAKVPKKEDDSIFILVSYFSVRQVRTLSRRNSWRHALDVLPRMLARVLTVQGLMLLLLLFPLLLLLLLHRELPFLMPRGSDSRSGRCWPCLCGWAPSSLIWWLPRRPTPLRWHRAKLCMAITRELREVALMAQRGFSSSSSSSSVSSSWHMPSSSSITARGPAAVPYKGGLPPPCCSAFSSFHTFIKGPRAGWTGGQLQRALLL